MALGSPTVAADPRGRPQAVSRKMAILPALLIVVGIGGRLAHMLADRSLWLDEAMLALNIVARSFADLLHPLDYAQGAPLGFLMLEKVSVTLFGPSEAALRLVPFLAAVGAVPLFHFVARRCLPRREALIALAFFALSPALVYYAAEAKQYSVDVFVAVLLLLATLHADQEHGSGVAAALLALLGAAAIWLSHPAVFVLAGAGAYLIGRRLRAGGRRDAVRFAVVATVWLVSFVLDVRVSLQDLAMNRFLLGYWDGGFPPVPLSLAALSWYPRAGQNLLALGFLVPFAGEQSSLVTTALCWTALAFACRWCVRHPWQALLLVGPLGVAFVAAALGRYPFAGRLLLFAVPSVFLVLAAGAGSAWRMTERSAASVGIVVLVGLLASCVLPLASWLAHPYKEELKPTLAWMSQRMAPDDVVYVHGRAVHAFTYYTVATNRFATRGAAIVQGRARQTDEASWAAAEVQQLMGHTRVWMVLTGQWSWSPHEHAALRSALEARGTQLDAFAATGASAALWNLSQGAGSSAAP